MRDDTVPDDRAPDGTAPDPRRWRALTVCLSAGFMTLLDVSIVNVALPSIRQGLDASPGQLQWVLAGYSLAFGLVLVPAGRIGDARGRRRVFLASLGLFVLTSTAAGLAQSAWWLVVARLAQGASAGVLNPQTAGVIQDLFRGGERGRAFGLMSATIGISTAVGPLVGGLILAVDGSDDGWRWVFLVNLPVGLAAIVLGWRLLPADRRRRALQARRESLDPVGALLLGCALLLVLLPLVQEREWTGPLPWLLVPAGLGLGAVFLRWERRYVGQGHAPLIDPGLYRTRSFRLGSFLAAAYFAGFTSLFFVVALFLQIGRGYSPLLSGLAVTPFALGSAVSAVVGGRLVQYAGRVLVLLGLALVIAGLAATDVVVAVVGGEDHVGWAIAVPLLVAGIGSGLVIAPNRTLVLAEVPVHRAGVAAGVLQVGQRVGAALGVASVGAVFFHAQARAGSWADGVVWALWAAIGYVVVALALGVVDWRRRARGRLPAVQRR